VTVLLGSLDLIALLEFLIWQLTTDIKSQRAVKTTETCLDPPLINHKYDTVATQYY